MVRDVTGIALFVLFVVVGVFPVYAMDFSDHDTLMKEGYTPLNGFQIASLVRNKTVTLTYGRNDHSTEIYFDGFGERLSYAKERKLTRLWRVSDDLYCETNLIGAGYSCSVVLGKEDSIRLCPTKENICWYQLSNFRDGDVLGLQQLPDGVVGPINTGG